MAVTLYASGTTGQTAGGAESFMSSPNAAGVYQLVLDLNLMAAGDVVEVRIWQIVLTGGTVRVSDVMRFYGVQDTDNKIHRSYPIPNDLTDTNSLRFGITQTFGTTRAFPFKVLAL